MQIAQKCNCFLCMMKKKTSCPAFIKPRLEHIKGFLILFALWPSGGGVITTKVFNGAAPLHTCVGIWTITDCTMKGGERVISQWFVGGDSTLIRCFTCLPHTGNLCHKLDQMRVSGPNEESLFLFAWRDKEESKSYVERLNLKDKWRSWICINLKKKISYTLYWNQIAP